MDNIKHTLWDEWASLPTPQSPEDEISGILEGLRYSASIDETAYFYTCPRLFVLRRLMKLWNQSAYQTADESSKIHIITNQHKSKTIFSISAAQFENIKNHSLSLAIRRRNWSWVRGLWGTAGSLYIPKTGYYLVIRVPNNELRSYEKIHFMLRSAGYSLGVREKSGICELMLRDQQQIVTFLSKLGFTSTLFALEETSILRSMRSHANKLVNCDSANINKSLLTAQKQMAFIRKIEEAGLPEDVPDVLRELFMLRKSNPSMSLKELGQSLSTPISKSTIEYRWKKLEIFMGIRNQQQ